MKTLFLGLLAIGMALNKIQAQEIKPLKPPHKVEVGVFAGLSYSYPIIRSQFPEHFARHTDRFVGIDIAYRLNDRASLRLQPTWMLANTFTLSGYYPSDVLSNTTLKIPVVYRHYVLPTRKILFIEAGMGFNHLINSNLSRNILVECFAAPCPTYYANLSPLTNSAISALGGIGVSIDLQKISIPVTLRYERFVTGYSFPDEYSIWLNPMMKFENFVITTGVNF